MTVAAGVSMWSRPVFLTTAGRREHAEPRKACAAPAKSVDEQHTQRPSGRAGEALEHDLRATSLAFVAREKPFSLVRIKLQCCSDANSTIGSRIGLLRRSITRRASTAETKWIAEFAARVSHAPEEARRGSAAAPGDRLDREISARIVVFSRCTCIRASSSAASPSRRRSALVIS
jgi:hypothetical protein